MAGSVQVLQGEARQRLRLRPGLTLTLMFAVPAVISTVRRASTTTATLTAVQAVAVAVSAVLPVAEVSAMAVVHVVVVSAVAVEDNGKV